MGRAYCGCSPHSSVLLAWIAVGLLVGCAAAPPMGISNAAGSADVNEDLIATGVDALLVSGLPRSAAVHNSHLGKDLR